MSDYEQAASYLLEQTSYRPQVAFVCGSGINLCANFTKSVSIPFLDIPGFTQPTVHGHSGELVFGLLGSVECVCMKGRIHYYEGHEMDKIVMPVRALRLMGVKVIVLTNAAGGLNPAYQVGDIVIIQDHFGMPCVSGFHPLRGINDSKLGPRFPSLSDAYDPKLQEIMMVCAEKLGLQEHFRPNGTYCYVSGPSYESRAECRFLQSIGGDSVGMSTVPEVIAAKHCGMKIIGLSVISDMVVLGKDSHTASTSHEEVLEAMRQAGPRVEQLVEEFVVSDSLRSYLRTIPARVYLPQLIPPNDPVEKNYFFCTVPIAMLVCGLIHAVLQGRI